VYSSQLEFKQIHFIILLVHSLTSKGTLTMHSLLCIELATDSIAEKLRASLELSRESLLESPLESSLSVPANCISAANDMHEAALVLKAYQANTVLCDVRAFGFAALAEVRSRSSSPLIVIALVSSDDAHGLPLHAATTAAMREALHYGADDVLPMSASAHEIWESLRIQRTKHDHIQSHIREEVCTIARNISRALPHEFRTPLNSLIGFTQVLRQHQYLSQELIDEAITYITTSAQRLHRTAEKFLLYAELENVAAYSHDNVMCQNTITQNVCPLLYETATDETCQRERYQDLMFTVENNADTVSVLAIRERYLQFIISELITNACKFSHAGTPIEVRVYTENNTFCVEISDQGRGMTDEEIQRITTFNQFNRERYEQQGVGLGLPIVKKIVEVFGGYCTIRNNHHAGITAKFGLPLPD
jgi:two-component system, sensor histidine kinase and response regulator